MFPFVRLVPLTNPIYLITMNYQKVSFREAQELPEPTEDELQELRDIEESNDYYGQALTAAERNR